MARTVRVELTVPQADALSAAACEVMAGEGASDVLDRAWTKLARAIVAASSKGAQKPPGNFS